MISRILYIGVLATIAFIFSGIQEVYAKDLKAVTNWSVSRIANPASGDPYCTLARGYEDNVVLTFAINLRDESSLGFDFQQKNLDTDRSYAIQLAAGLDLNRSFDVTPATPKALVIRLGKDKAFFEALQRAKFLGFNLNQRQFNFDFADFAEGMTQIKGCLDTFRTPQEDVATPALRAQLSQNQRTLQGFEAQIKQLESENNNLRTALGNATERARIAQQQAAKQTQIAQDAKRNAELSIAQPPAIAPIEAVDTGVVTKLQTRLRDMLRDVSALKQENANLQSEVLKLSAQPQASTAPASNGYSGPQISAAEFELVKRQLNDKTNALKIAEERITNILRDKSALASKVQMLNEKISQQERQLQLETQVTRNIPALPVSGVEARSLRTTTANVTDRVERIDQVRQEERAFQGGEVLDEVVNNPVAIRDLSTTKTQELRAQGNIVATRRDLARSRSITARERRISDAARQKLDLANVPKARNEERLTASTARIQNLSRPSPIFDGPDEQGAEQELRAFSPSLAAANAITAGAIKSGRVSAGELSDISAPAAPVALAATNVTNNNSENLLPPLKPKPVQGHSYLEALLLDANIPITTELAKLDHISNQNFTAYQWDSGETFGSAEVTNTKTPDAFDVLSQAYLERTKRRCNGEFASIPTTGFQDNERLAGYDVACVSGANQGAVASLLFHIKDNKFITLAFESTAANIEKAMRVRDQLAQSIAAN